MPPACLPIWIWNRASTPAPMNTSASGSCGWRSTSLPSMASKFRRRWRIRSRGLPRRNPRAWCSCTWRRRCSGCTIDQRWPLAEALCSHSEFADDRMLPLMIWYGIEPAVPRDRARALKLIAASKIPLVRQYAARRLTEDIESEPATVNALVELAERSDPPWHRISSPEWPRRCAAGAKRRSRSPGPARQSKFTASGSAELKKHAQELGVVFGDGRATDELRAIVVNGDAEPGARRQALRALLAGKPADLVGSLQDLAGDRVMASEAIRGLALYDHPDTPGRILQNWDRYGPAERAETINTLCSRPAYAQALLDMLREGKISEERRLGFPRPTDSGLRRSGSQSPIGRTVGRRARLDRRQTRVDRPLQVANHARLSWLTRSRRKAGPCFRSTAQIATCCTAWAARWDPT